MKSLNVDSSSIFHQLIVKVVDKMEKLLELLKDGNARSLEMLAIELDTSAEDVRRKIDFLEKMQVIKRVAIGGNGCGSCGGCNTCSNHGGHSGSTCAGCIPEGGFSNMGQMWEVL